MEIFEKSPNEIQREFDSAFEEAMKRFKPPKSLEERPGVISRITNLAGVDAYAESNGIVMKVEAQLRNLSPLREMAFYVAVVSDSGSIAEWYLPRMKMSEFQQLEPKIIRGRGFNVHVLSTPADSDVNARWQQGQLPTVRVRR